MRFRIRLVITILFISTVVSSPCPAKLAQRWSEEKANAWYAKKPAYSKRLGEKIENISRIISLSLVDY